MKRIITLICMMFLVFSVVRAANLPTVEPLENRLQFEIQKMIQAGHLRTEFHRTTEHYLLDAKGSRGTVPDFHQYYHNPADTIYTLAIAYHHLPETAYPGSSNTWKQKLQEYMVSEQTSYPICQYTHMGASGTPRSLNNVPDSLSNQYASEYNIRSNPGVNGWEGWSFNPFNFYAAYKYAEITGQVSQMLQACRNNGRTPKALPSSSFLQSHPFVINVYISGYVGWLQLQDLAGENRDSTVQNWLQQAYNLKVSHLKSIDPNSIFYLQTGGLLYITPELGDYLYQNARSDITRHINVHDARTPYWMQPQASEPARSRGYGKLEEGTKAHIYDYWGPFQARAYALKFSRAQLEALLHGPVFYRGDLYYIQNLVAAIEAGIGTPSICGDGACNGKEDCNSCEQDCGQCFTLEGDANQDGSVDLLDLILVAQNFAKTSNFDPRADLNNDGQINLLDLIIVARNFGKKG